jgi:hypothetical protein
VRTSRFVIPVAWFALSLVGGDRGEAQAPFDVAYSQESRAAIGAHNLCSGLWVVGRVYKRSPAEIVAQDIAPFAMFGWEPGFTYSVDSAGRTVTVRAGDTPPRTAKYNGDQGCSIMPRGESELHFKPVAVPRNLPDASTQRWPMGDLGANATFPEPHVRIDSDPLQE